MRMVEIKALANGAHRNLTTDSSAVPEGWAVIPENMETERFPFGEVTAEDIDGVMTVTGWIPGTVPEPPLPKPSEQADTDELLVDHEYRLTLLELGVMQDAV